MQFPDLIISQHFHRLSQITILIISTKHFKKNKEKREFSLIPVQFQDSIIFLHFHRLSQTTEL